MTISLANDKNNQLSQSFANTFLAVENDEMSRGNKEVFEFMIEREGCENRIAIAKREYNNLCKEYGRSDLLFDNDNISRGHE